jgi:hypothetical protein
MDTFSFSEFMREGGWGMWPILLLGVVAVGAAGRYAARPERNTLGFVAALWLTLAATVAHATLTDVAAVFHYFQDEARSPNEQFARLLVVGLKESTRPFALGGVFLTLVPLLVAVGISRSAARPGPTAA